MIFEKDNIINFIKENDKPSSLIINARKNHLLLQALILGENFDDLLITKIEHLESEEKIKARKKYSRDIRDFFTRLMQPIDNCFYASGGSFKINTPNKDFVNKISNIRDGKSIRKYIQEYLKILIHTDPNGVIFMEYTSATKLDCYPTYKSINDILNYKTKGQELEYILFEPTILEDGKRLYRLVDDKTDYTVLRDGENYEIVEESTFVHPFGSCPCFIISNIEDIKSKERLSYFHNVLGIAKELARDLSIKTLYKFLHGFPIHWRYVTMCRTCNGTGKVDDHKCKDCDGHGYYKSKDVTDQVNLPIPDKEDHVIAPNIAGYTSPDLETWKRYDEELEYAERLANDTQWGTHKEKSNNETATGRFIDVQPISNKLNVYSDLFEWFEWKILELTANCLIPSKQKDLSVVSVNYGRRFIIESPDVLEQNYYKAKESGANISILDRIYLEIITQKYINDPKWLQIELKKASLEPYLHLSIQEVSEVFGQKEAYKKDYFIQWWKENSNKIDTLTKESFNLNFNIYYASLQISGVSAVIN
jgi:hypothetical protein